MQRYTIICGSQISEIPLANLTKSGKIRQKSTKNTKSNKRRKMLKNIQCWQKCAKTLFYSAFWSQVSCDNFIASSVS